MLLGVLLVSCSLILRWMMGNAAVEASSLYWLQPVAYIWMVIVSFVNLWTHPTDMFESKPTNKEDDITKE